MKFTKIAVALLATIKAAKISMDDSSQVNQGLDEGAKMKEAQKGMNGGKQLSGLNIMTKLRSNLDHQSFEEILNDDIDDNIGDDIDENLDNTKEDEVR